MVNFDGQVVLKSNDHTEITGVVKQITAYAAIAAVYIFPMHENDIGNLLLDAAFEVHKTLGPGLLESSYEHCLAFELVQRGLNVKVQWPLPLVYKNVKLDCGYRLDLLVEDKVVVEVKAIEALNDLHMAQMLTYLKLTGCRLGYLLNFNVVLFKTGIRRVVNNL